MSITTSTIQRDAAGRFVPGQSGNPSGKQPGTRNRATRLRELVEDGEERIIGRVLIDKAKAGDAVAARFVIGHLMPAPRSRAIELDLPEGTWAGDIVAAFNATMMAMAAGEITPDEALTITRTFDGRLKALKAWEMERWLTRYEQIPGDTAFEAPAEEEEEEDDDDDDEAEEAQGEGVSPAKNLHPGEHPHPDPPEHLSKGPAGEGVGAALAESSEAPAAAQTEPSPCGRGQGEGVSPANALHLDEHPHPACIQPSPATIAGRRRVAEAVLRQWARTLPG